MGESKYKSRSVPPTSRIEDLLEFTDISDHNMTAIHSRTSQTLDAFASLEPDQNIVLLSPAVPNPTIHDMDPFESFGKTLSRHHQRIMHVPYVPQDGLVNFHKQMFSNAGAAIIIVAEPTQSPKVDSKILPKHSLKKQLKFVDALLVSTDYVPLILVLIISTTDLWKELSGLKDLWEDLDTVLRASDYEEATLRKLARMVFMKPQGE